MIGFGGGEDPAQHQKRTLSTRVKMEMSKTKKEGDGKRAFYEQTIISEETTIVVYGQAFTPDCRNT